jgi:hypothetical protein
MSYPILYDSNVVYDQAIYSISKFINNNVKDNEVVWGIDEVRGYYIKDSNKRFIQDNYLLAFSYLIKNNNNKDVLNVFKKHNIKYFLWRGSGENYSERMLWAKMPNGSKDYSDFTLKNYKMAIDFKNEYMELVHAEKGYYLYRLKDKLISK